MEPVCAVGGPLLDIAAALAQAELDSQVTVEDQGRCRNFFGSAAVAHIGVFAPVEGMLKASGVAQAVVQFTFSGFPGSPTPRRDLHTSSIEMQWGDDRVVGVAAR